ncbi:uncharacterized protein BDR25DRAFT_312893 [Lindgomyces ingoldianus]|uniref:Uncharacterized protein n=1 Tax=Lindgomyces ingoldianus TaxID=673940 RepID=A0ACB6QZB9_9PLEO|nr:uncharacterized protein BDR25DRAFT_312893 [Lindgomyces ingoldianus]KAF2472334.1 hypothetical protein BDR25DRAFT_312893 [Lindgomyces ingoldianus]
MLPSLLTDTYHRYKQDTDNIATWLATTAKRFGFPADLIGKAQNKVQKSQRLKGKARNKAKQIAKSNAASASKPSSTSLPKYALCVKDFVTLAEYLASKPDVKVPAQLWASIERAIRLRQMQTDYHALQQASNTRDLSDEGHSYFLGILEKVRDVLKPYHQAGVVQPQDKSTAVPNPDKEIEGCLDNMFAVLTVEEPSEDFLNAPDTAPAVGKVEPASSLYEVEPFDDPLELYLGTAALLQDCSKIRSAIGSIWHSYSQSCTSLISAAVTTNVAIQMAQELEEQFLKDHPSQQDTVRARTVFFGAQCFLQGQDPATCARQSDPINLSLYGLVETSLLGSHALLDAFKDVIQDNQLPLYKPGFFGVYDPTKDRRKMSGPEKFDEDKVLLLEVLSDIVFFDYANGNVGLPAADKLTKDVGLLREQGRHTLALDFAAQIYLDIEHILRSKSGMAWADLRHYALNAKASLRENFQFHEQLRVKTWPRENDQPLRAILEIIERWFEVDTFQRLKAERMIQSGLHPDLPATQHSFFTSHPWLCGSLLFGMKLDMQEAGIAFLNAWGSAKFAAQIYNAAQKEKFLDKEWQDMELALMFYGESVMFVGSRPDGVEEYFRRFCLAIGYSAQNFARGGARSHSRPVESRQGPRGVIEKKTASPVAHELGFGYSRLDDSGKSAPNIEQVLEKCLGDNDELDVADTAEMALMPKHHKSPRKRKMYTTPEVLILICQSLMSEELALTFDHFRLHRSAWRVLRSIKDTNAGELRRIYGPSYLENESQLPYVAGYIFMTAVQTEKIGGLLRPKKEYVVSSKLLMQAADILECMIESGMGGLEVRILREKYDMEFEVEKEGAGQTSGPQGSR